MHVQPLSGALGIEIRVGVGQQCADEYATGRDSAADLQPRSDVKRASIVAAAQERFVQDGFDASLDVIAAQAGVSKVTVYNHFKNKEALFKAVIGAALDAGFRTAITSAETWVESQDEPREALRGVTQALVDGLINPPLLAIRNLVTAELRRFPELGDAWEASGSRQVGLVLSQVLEGLTARDALSIADVPLAAIQLAGLTFYPHVVAGSVGGTLDPEIVDRLIEHGVDMFLSFYGRD